MKIARAGLKVAEWPKFAAERNAAKSSRRLPHDLLPRGRMLFRLGRAT